MNTLNRLPVYLFIYLFIFTLVPPSGCSMNRHQTQLELIYEQMMSNLISFKKRKTRPLLQYILLKYTFSLFTASVHCFLKLILFPQTFTFFLLFLEPFYPSLVSLIDLIVFSSVNSFASTHLYNAKKTLYFK